MKSLALFVFIGCCFASISSIAQTPKQIEANLLKSFNRIDFWNEKSRTDTTGNLAYEDSLESANEIFAKKLSIYSNKFPVTINQPFTLLKEDGLDINTSDDGLFRIYSWDTWTGGTMHFFESVFQFRVGKQTYSILDTPKTEGDVRPNYNKLYTLRTSDKVYYLAVTLDVGSTKDFGGSIQVFDIENGKLNDSVKLIKAQSGLHSNLSYYYDLSKSSGKLTPSDYPTVHYDAPKKMMYIPLIEENNAATKNFITYKFTGKYFEKVKN